jgi:hypothetical protein
VLPILCKLAFPVSIKNDLENAKNEDRHTRVEKEISVGLEKFVNVKTIKKSKSTDCAVSNQRFENASIQSINQPFPLRAAWIEPTATLNFEKGSQHEKLRQQSGQTQVHLSLQQILWFWYFVLPERFLFNKVICPICLQIKLNCSACLEEF